MSTHVSFQKTTALAAIAILIGIAGVAFQAARLHGAHLTANDFTPDYVSARAWLQGGDPYDPVEPLIHRYIGPQTPYYQSSPPSQVNSHPPVTVGIFSLFAWLPYKLARIMWLVVSAMLVAISVGAVARRLGLDRPASVAVGAVSIVVPVVQSELSWGQQNSVLLALLVLAWLHIRSAERLAGFALGSAVAIKLFPILLILPLLRARKLRAIRWTVGSAAVLSVLGTLLVGLSATSTFVNKLAPDAAYWRGILVNHSLVGLLYRWLTPNVWNRAHLNLPVVAAGLTMLITIAGLVAATRTMAGRSGDPFWSAIPWILLVTPLTWTPSFVLLLPLVLCILVKNIREGRPGLGMVAVCSWLLSAFPDLYRTGGIPIWLWSMLFTLPIVALLLFAVLDFPPATAPDQPRDLGATEAPPSGVVLGTSA